MNQEFYIIFGIFIGIFIGYVFGKIIKHKELSQHRKTSVKKSRSVILGETYEKIAPLLNNIPYHPKDMTFLGKGVDYVIFDGLSEGKLKGIVFLEIKTGKSRQNANEKQIERIISTKKIKYELRRLG